MKIAYIMLDHAYKRVFQSFVDDKRAEQIFVAKPPVITNKIIPEDYNDCGISKKIFISNYGDIQTCINKMNPDVYVQSDLSDIHKSIKLPPMCKRVFIHHGLDSSKRMLDIAVKYNLLSGLKNSWGGFDMYCGASNNFTPWLNGLGIKDNNKIILDALPQLDLVYNKDYNVYRGPFLAFKKLPNVEKIILFFGQRCGGGEYVTYNKGNFDILFELERLAIQNNWLILAKPRNGFKKTMNFLTNNEAKYSWIKKYKELYSKIQQSSRIHFISTNTHPYYYYFADVIVSVGLSSVEIEAAAARKPLVVYKPDGDDLCPDGMRSVEFGVAYQSKQPSDIENAIFLAINDNKLLAKQEEYIKQIGITHDGKMHERALNAILRLK